MAGLRRNQMLGSEFAAMGFFVLVQIVFLQAVFHSVSILPVHERATGQQFIDSTGDLLKEPNEISLDIGSRCALIALLIPSSFFMTAIWVKWISIFVPVTRLGSLLRLLTMSLVFQLAYLALALITTNEFKRCTSVVAFGIVPIVAEFNYIVWTSRDYSADQR